MGNQRVKMFFAWVFISLFQGITSGVLFPDKGFQFNCGVDICTFPLQYCDTAKDVCKYCNKDLCNTDDVPQQCYKACTGNNQ